MRDETAQALTDLAVLAAAVAVTYVVLTKPPLRRAAARLLKYALLTGLPRYLWQETTRAWEDSDPRRHPPAIMGG